ncbi:hypothetical protein, partial [Enterobacter hormaechei]|uniref:hypothetical protein n=1 Tax=Enterobacter hormaechei TaxID=158836 RepID=UPI001596859F
KQPQHFRLDGPTRLKFTQDLTERKTRMDWVRNFMRQLEENAIGTSRLYIRHNYD